MRKIELTLNIGAKIGANIDANIVANIGANIGAKAHMMVICFHGAHLYLSWRKL